MQKRFNYLILPLILSLAACANSNVDQTLVAQNEMLGTQVAYLYETATVDADHIMITLENAQAQQTSAQFQNNMLVGTLIARNVDPTALAMFTPQGNLVFGAQATPLPSTAGQDGATILVPTPQGARETATPIAVVPPPETTVEAAASGGALNNLVTSTGVGNDDCAIDQITQFTTANAEIYVVARTQGIRAGMNLLSRWYFNGTEQISHDFTPDNDIVDGRCIWFFIDQGEVVFTAGNWSVQLEIDGTPVASTQFTISP